MDGDLRYISLQYIKGTNYEEITCYDYDKIKELLEKESLPGNLEDPSKLFRELSGAQEEDKCNIGESFLNDLVNYYNFKEIKRLLKNAKVTTTDAISNNKKKEPEVEPTEGDVSNKIDDNEDLIKELRKLQIFIQKVTGKRDLLPNALQAALDKQEANIQNIIVLLEALYVRSSEEINENNQTYTSVEITEFKDDMKDARNLEKFKSTQKILINALLKNLNIKGNSICLAYKNIAEKNNNVYNKIKIFKKNIKEFERKLNELYILLLQGENDKQKELGNKRELLYTLIKLYNTYIKICDMNIERYDKLFKYNEISNIDEAFMIESYAKFLKKLKRLKENLESKDTGKLKRLLVNSLNKLFNTYGIDPNKSLSATDMAYLESLIL